MNNIVRSIVITVTLLGLGFVANAQQPTKMFTHRIPGCYFAGGDRGTHRRVQAGVA